jgi:hypothetical protein
LEEALDDGAFVVMVLTRQAIDYDWVGFYDDREEFFAMFVDVRDLLGILFRRQTSC